MIPFSKYYYRQTFVLICTDGILKILSLISEGRNSVLHIKESLFPLLLQCDQEKLLLWIRHEKTWSETMESDKRFTVIFPLLTAKQRSPFILTGIMGLH